MFYNIPVIVFAAVAIPELMVQIDLLIYVWNTLPVAGLLHLALTVGRLGNN